MNNNIISLDEEVRCDFVVTTERKKIWAVELDLLQKFIKVCDKYNLKWFAIGGTLLGAVRHKGFIPWDDDIDVTMPRADYEIFKTLSHEFEHPYFLQHPDTEVGYGFSFMKIRNSNTTALSETMMYCSMNQGIFLDIFPLDNVNADSFEKNRSEIYDLIMHNSVKMKSTHPAPSDRSKDHIAKYSDDRGSLQEVCHKIDEVATRHKDEETIYVSLSTCTIYSSEKSVWLSSSFDDFTIMDFEGIPMRVPVGYEDILTRNFGNYMEFPPVESRGTWHSGVIWNPDKPYKEYLAEMLKKDEK